MGISFSNIGTVGREQLITSGSNGEPNWSYIPSKGKSTKKVNNRTYQFADEKTKKQIAYMSGYYLQTVPQSVKAAWQETLEETGFNPFQTDVTSILTQLSVEQDFLTGGDDNIFGETKESCFSSYRQSIGENRKSVGSSYRGKGSISAAGKRILYRTGI